MSAPVTPAGDAASLAGVPWLITDMALVTGMTVLVKLQGATYPALQLVLIRALVGLVAILPFVWARRAAFRRMTSPWRNAGRVTCNAVALTLNFVALSALPLALVNAIGFTRPMVSMALAALILKERITRWRWFCAALALAGVMVLISPDTLIVSAALLAAGGSVFFGSMAAIQTRALRGEDTAVMMLFYTLGLAVLTLGPALWVWQPVKAGDWPALLAIGILAQVAQLCFLRAYRQTEASRLAPFSYLSILFATTAGWIVFAEVPQMNTALGAAIIILALHLNHRQDKRAGRPS